MLKRFVWVAKMKFEETNRESKKCKKSKKSRKKARKPRKQKTRRTDLEVPNKCLQVQSDGGEFYRSTVLLVADFMVTILVRLVG